MAYSCHDMWWYSAFEILLVVTWQIQQSTTSKIICTFLFCCWVFRFHVFLHLVNARICYCFYRIRLLLLSSKCVLAHVKFIDELLLVERKCLSTGRILYIDIALKKGLDSSFSSHLVIRRLCKYYSRVIEPYIYVSNTVRCFHHEWFIPPKSFHIQISVQNQKESYLISKILPFFPRFYYFGCFRLNRIDFLDVGSSIILIECNIFEQLFSNFALFQCQKKIKVSTSEGKTIETSL